MLAALLAGSRFGLEIPAVGAAFDLGKTKEDYWKPVFAGYDFTKQWEKTHKPDVIFLARRDLEHLAKGADARGRACRATGRRTRQRAPADEQTQAADDQ